MKGSSNVYEYLLKQGALMKCRGVLAVFHAASDSGMCYHSRWPLGSLVETLARPIRESKGTQGSVPAGGRSCHPTPMLASFSAQR